MEESRIGALIAQMAAALAKEFADRAVRDPAMVGIHSGGAWLAERLHRLLGLATPLGTLDISFYRDDFTRIGMNPQVRPSHLPFNVDDRHIVLVDDVLHTGRTIRAALNELFDYGRPASVMLVVLVERPGREIPIAPLLAGTRVDLKPGEHIKLSGPEPLALTIHHGT